MVLDRVDDDLKDGVHGSIERVELVEHRLKQRYDRHGKPWGLAEWLQFKSSR